MKYWVSRRRDEVGCDAHREDCQKSRGSSLLKLLIQLESEVTLQFSSLVLLLKHVALSLDPPL